MAKKYILKALISIDVPELVLMSMLPLYGMWNPEAHFPKISPNPITSTFSGDETISEDP